jgi:hypothetical protein
MRQWVVVETQDEPNEIVAVYGPFDHEGLARAFAEAYGFQIEHHLVRVFELNKELK